MSLLAHPEVKPAGLGARDTLRLEAGMCLYGHDIDDTTSPVEAGLTWAIQKVRRPGGARAGGYPGAEPSSKAISPVPPRASVWACSDWSERPCAKARRSFDAHGRKLGTVTSGTLAPSVNQPIAMAYLPLDHAKPRSTRSTPKCAAEGLPMRVVPHALPPPSATSAELS
jgi:aminomethyltransferase